MTERWVKMVEKVKRYDDWGLLVVSSSEVVKLLARQHRAMVRMVKAMRKDGAEFGSENYGYNKACDDILAALAKQGGGKK